LKPAVATEGDEVQVLRFVVATEMLRHALAA